MKPKIEKGAVFTPRLCCIIGTVTRRVSLTDSYFKTTIFGSAELLSRSFRFLGEQLKGTADEILFLELALRGYDRSKLRDEETTAEIVKIGIFS